MEQESVQNAINLINEAKSVAIVPSIIAGTDSFSAAAGLYYMLTDLKKDVYFINPTDIPDDAKNLMDEDRIIKNINERELMVEIDYSKTPAGAAHYATENDVLHIKIGPVSKDFDTEQKVKAKLVGYDFDLVVVLGAQELSDLGSIYDYLRDTAQDAKVLNIDNTERNEKFGNVNLIDTLAKSLSQQVFKLANLWDIVPNEKSAKALLTGMTYRNGNN